MLQAALSLFSERGFEATTMDAIARQAGVTKPTLYNHWADKEALMLEVMLHVNGLNQKREDADTGVLANDIATVLTRRPPDEFADARDRMMPGLIAYSATHPEFGAAWRNNVVEPPRRCLRRILLRAIQRGKLHAGLDLDLSMSLLLGPMLYGHIFGGKTRSPNEKLGRMTAEAFVRAFSKS
jgi:AcrR family transcriptional regulator